MGMLDLYPHRDFLRRISSNFKLLVNWSNVGGLFPLWIQSEILGWNQNIFQRGLGPQCLGWAGRQSGRGLGSFRQLRVPAVRSETCGGEPRKTREGGTTQQIQSTVRPFRKGESNLDKLRILSRRVRARAENTEIKGENSELLTWNVNTSTSVQI